MPPIRFPNPEYPSKPGKGMPGTELKALLESITIIPKNCSCNARAQQMDLWGTEICKLHREEIIEWLRMEEDSTGWLQKVRAALAAVRTGLAFKLDPLDPIPGLVDEALRRAEEKDKQS